MSAIPDLRAPRPNLLISFAQFRPEKDHAMQLRIWKRLLPRLPRDAKFWLVGTVRDEGDRAILEGLKDQARALGVETSVDFMVNRSRQEILEIFSQAKVAMHTMKNEHFGIAVVELMAAGIVTIAHKSAGPLYDIIGGTSDAVGFLAENEGEYEIFVDQALNHFDQQMYCISKTYLFIGLSVRKLGSGSATGSVPRNSTRDSLTS